MQTIFRRSAPLATAIFGLLTASTWAADTHSALTAARNKLVDDEIVAAGVKSRRVIQAMRDTPRHEFVPTKDRANAYKDMALPIGEGQTISPPFIVAYMTESIDPQPGDKVLEIGTGSGYQAAVLSPLVRDVYTIEIVAPLGHKAAKLLQRLHYTNVHAKVGDGYLGWPEYAPFDKIIVTCSPESVPQALVDQLREGGLMVIPTGQRYQQSLYLLEKKDGKMKSRALLPVLFVPMTGAAEHHRRVQPDPLHPALENGDFEEVDGDPPHATGWYYQRQMKLISDDNAPSGKNYVTFHNADPGRGAQSLQGFAIDGRKINRLELTFHVRGKDIRPGQTSQQTPGVGLIFYDDNRTTVGTISVGSGSWRGTFAWQREKHLIDVPPRAREAIMVAGLLGSVGDLSFDDIQIRPVKKELRKK
jgi:protein-L-isoaspartate(D-aspartate) O-methyltransferase